MDTIFVYALKVVDQDFFDDAMGKIRVERNTRWHGETLTDLLRDCGLSIINDLDVTNDIQISDKLKVDVADQLYNKGIVLEFLYVRYPQYEDIEKDLRELAHDALDQNMSDVLYDLVPLVEKYRGKTRSTFII